jgi:hypothetical protein
LTCLDPSSNDLLTDLHDVHDKKNKEHDGSQCKDGDLRDRDAWSEAGSAKVDGGVTEGSGG